SVFFGGKSGGAVEGRARGPQQPTILAGPQGRGNHQPMVPDDQAARHTRIRVDVRQKRANAFSSGCAYYSGGSQTAGSFFGGLDDVSDSLSINQHFADRFHRA